MSNKYYGIYRGIVTDIDDPSGRMRIKVKVPAILGDTELPWALSCVSGGRSRIPEVGTLVWIQFEGGDPSYPVWMGIVRGGTLSDEDDSGQ